MVVVSRLVAFANASAALFVVAVNTTSTSLNAPPERATNCGHSSIKVFIKVVLPHPAAPSITSVCCGVVTRVIIAAYASC